MQAPVRQPISEFAAAMVKWAAMNSCEQCGGKLSLSVCYVSFHSSEFGSICAGEGRCEQIDIPFCSRCELTPDTSGCVHAPIVNLRHPLAELVQ